jgi:hypothetical protein
VPRQPLARPKVGLKLQQNLFLNSNFGLATNPVTRLATNPQLALAPKFDLTPFNAAGVRSSAANRPASGKCKCPPAKKAKKQRPGRGFFVVSPSGLERRKYWKTGKNHTKEYRNARNTSRDFRRSGRKQLKSVLRFGV